MKKILVVLLLATMLMNLPAYRIQPNDAFAEGTAASVYAGLTAEEIVAKLTLEQKAGQMVMAAVYNLAGTQMSRYCYGSVLSTVGSNTTYTDWQEVVASIQAQALQSEAAIPFLYGQDDVHGVNYCAGAVIFPHNIGIGAANDVELTYEMALAVADEAKLCHMLWNYAPCVAQAVDPRWGRTYESYSTDLGIIQNLSVAYVNGMNDGGVVSCAKHFFADGNVEYGTGEVSDVRRIIDRGDAQLTEAEISALLGVYQALIDAGVPTIMASHSSVNGVKMHENAAYLQYLKNEMGFQGYIAGDWNSVERITGDGLKEKVIKAVNAGVDMLMEVDKYNLCIEYIVAGVNEGKIPQERVDDAVTRIIQVKLDAGLFDDPFCERIETKQTATGSEEYRSLAERLVEKSLVLVKNEQDVLPLKPNAKVYLTGPAADNVRAQCGGWTGLWLGMQDVVGVTTIQAGLLSVAEAQGMEIITDPERADEADVVLLVVGEESYAEWEGDTEDLSLTGKLGLKNNAEAIEEAARLGKPTVACIVAGRQVLIEAYKDDWDAIVMCYLPGSEGRGVANVLTGKAEFSGKLPMPWYSALDQIGTDECWLEVGYGLTY